MKSMKLIDSTITIRKIIDKIVRRECLVCKRNLHKELGDGWNIPLCQRHRILTMEEFGNE